MTVCAIESGPSAVPKPTSAAILSEAERGALRIARVRFAPPALTSVSASRPVPPEVPSAPRSVRAVVSKNRLPSAASPAWTLPLRAEASICAATAAAISEGVTFDRSSTRPASARASSRTVTDCVVAASSRDSTTKLASARPLKS